MSLFAIMFGFIMYFIQRPYEIIVGEIIKLQSKNNNSCDSSIEVSYNINLLGVPTSVNYKYSCNIYVKSKLGEHKISVKNSYVNYFLGDTIKLYHYKDDNQNNVYIYDGDKYYLVALYGLYVSGILFLTSK
jgi:hypothetical protein